MRLYEIENFYQKASKLQIYKIVESRNTGAAKTHVLADLIYYGNNNRLWKEFDLNSLLEGKNQESQTSEKKPVMVAKTCPLFNETLTRAIQLRGREFLDTLKRFMEFKYDAAKSGNPLQPYGARDRPFKGGGLLKNAVPNETLIHAHLSHGARDINLVYSMTGRNPVVYKLYGLFTHDDLGIGEPANIKTQRQQARVLANQNNWNVYFTGP